MALGRLEAADAALLDQCTERLLVLWERL